MPDLISVVIADDHPLYREGIAATLRVDPGIQLHAAAEDAQQAVEFAEKYQPDVILLDLSMPGGGLSAIPEIRQKSPGTRIAMLTVSESDDDVMRALKLGALGYVLKGVGGRELVSIVRDLAEGRSYVSPALAANLLTTMQNRNTAKSNDPMGDLTHREEEILKLVAKGLSNKEVGRELDIQEKTVKHYMTSILQKLHVRNRVEAAVKARNFWN
ncbi:MAG TPA: response regulator transcription factor [Paracoccaceae bacterium]|nr:response regulator transcription factor [Paracoccaceae bacterium]